MNCLLLTSTINNYTVTRFIEELNKRNVSVFINSCKVTDNIDCVINRKLKPLGFCTENIIKVQYNPYTSTKFIDRAFMQKSIKTNLEKIPGFVYNNESYKDIVNELGSPFIIKEKVSNKSSGVKLISSKRSFKQLKDFTTCEKFLSSKDDYVKLKLLVLNGVIIAAIKYTSGNWQFKNATIVELSNIPYVLMLCVKELFDEYNVPLYTMDVLVNDNKYFFSDVCSVPKLRLFETITKRNLAGTIVDSMISDVNNSEN